MDANGHEVITTSLGNEPLTATLLETSRTTNADGSVSLKEGVDVALNGKVIYTSQPGDASPIDPLPRAVGAFNGHWVLEYALITNIAQPDNSIGLNARADHPGRRAAQRQPRLPGGLRLPAAERQTVLLLPPRRPDRRGLRRPGNAPGLRADPRITAAAAPPRRTPGSTWPADLFRRYATAPTITWPSASTRPPASPHPFPRPPPVPPVAPSPLPLGVLRSRRFLTYRSPTASPSALHPRQFRPPRRTRGLPGRAGACGTRRQCHQGCRRRRHPDRCHTPPIRG